MSSDDPSVPFGYCHCGCGELAPLAKATKARLGHIKGQPVRFVAGHQNRKRFGPQYTVEGDCWIWQHGLTRDGYGALHRGLAHRVFWEEAHGPVPDGLELDHLCRNRACVNPAHLEPVSHAENCRRGTNARLSPDDITAIRKSSKRQTDLAREYGVTKNTVWRIRHHDLWKED